ncbi:MAG: hypothetical protein MJZ30_10655 [Paludibacteraceae bacterium]|nr:hypothetical protein [Paludibacteraceae bacterium]
MVFDDTIKYDCFQNKERSMLGNIQNYSRIGQSEHYEYRYVITEEDYEYAKKHPYKETEE